MVEAFSSWQKKGFVELLATCATDIFIPYYSNLEETVNAQIETGLHSHRMYFGDNPLGFYIPEMAYIRGIESSLRSYGFSYSVLDSRALLFTEEELKKGIFSPVVSDDNIIFFASDNRAVQNLEDFSKNDLYCDCARDIAFELPQEKLSPYIEKGFSRCPSSFCYWNNGGKSFSGQLKSKYTYNQKDAFKQCEKDAEVFLSEKLELLNKAESLFKEKEQSCLVFSICANELARTWKEFPVFIENLFRKANQNLFTDFSSIIGKKDVLQKVKPYYSSAGLSGYGEAFLSNKNNWMIKYVRKASARMQDLALRFPDGTGLKERLLNLGAKELLLAHSSILGKMVYNDEFPEYAVDSFKERLLAFTTVFESLGSNTVSTEWLCDLENRHPIFSWLNYRIFTKKQ
ncbi:MAG: DUF1957 domain-containing protein [Treponema sp.]|nr:DUF1957 domain-containing protein [Treponema sp.]